MVGGFTYTFVGNEHVEKNAPPSGGLLFLIPPRATRDEGATDLFKMF